MTAKEQIYSLIEQLDSLVEQAGDEDAQDELGYWLGGLRDKVGSCLPD